MITYIIKEKGFEGYIAIDSTVNGRCFGGIRILNDVTLEEIKQLARTMTLKYGFFGIKKGGAKAGLRINKNTGEERVRILKRFGESIKPLINESFWPGFDMGCSIEDFKNMMRGAGRNVNPNLENKSDKYTGYTIFECAKIGGEMKNISLKEAKYAIEGFGKVGLACAEMFSEAGSKLVAASTIKGGIYNKKGLDINTLKKLRAEHGDDFVKHYSDGEKISKKKLLELDVDVLIPCARPNSINKNNSNKIKAKIISPGANSVMSLETDKELFKKGILAFPDFISNSGGVIGSVLSLSDNKIKNLIEKTFHNKVKNAMTDSINNKIAPYENLSRIALERFAKMKEREEKRFRNRKIDQANVMFSRMINRLHQDKDVRGLR